MIETIKFCEFIKYFFKILKEDENGWFNVKLNNETGLYPGNYLEKI